uniref:Uncharacterized protein n=1 Tax=Globodera rostochiensis TaxID=31243 RepID=A0A914H0Q3_GLORO
MNANPLSAKKQINSAQQSKTTHSMDVAHQLLVNSPSKKRIYGTAPEEKKLQSEEQAKPEKMAKVSSEVSSIDLGGHKVDSIGQHTENIGGQNVEQPGTPQIEEHAIASTSESMDPKSQLEELLEMNDALMWEMAVRSEDELITDLEDELITDLEDELITDLEDELITDLEDDTDTDDDLLQWFPALIFMKLKKFLPNVPQGDGQHKAELTKLVASWKAEKQPIDIEHETAHVKKIENNLDTYREELRERIMTGVNGVTPGVLDTLLDQGINDSHAEEKNAFLWKMVIQKPTRYVKNVGQFFGGIEIATAYLNQAVEIGQWAQNSDFLKSAQLENLSKLVEQNLSELANLRDAMAVKLGIDLAKIDMPKLMAKNSPSLDNVFTRNLPEKHAEIKDIAQREEAKINDAQIAAVHLFTALSAASTEVAALEAELLGIKITWRAFQTVGDVSKMAQILRQI